MQYADFNGKDFNLGTNLYCMPEVLMRAADGKTTERMTVAILEKAGAGPVQPWGRNFSEAGTFAGTKWTKVRRNLWETLMINGMQPDVKFSVTPDLPEGLFISQTTGVIHGRPRECAARNLYTVTAQNESGQCETKLNFGIVMLPPRSLQYPECPEVLHEMEPVSIHPEV